MGGATAASVPPVGKLGYVVNVGTDGRAWRSTSWEKYISDMRESINLIRCADWTRYKSIAGEFVVRVEAAEWVAKLASYEFIAPCPGWADTVGHLPSLRCLNVFGKEEMLFAGKVSRTDYSLISWEQFVPRGHIYDRKLTFNSLLLACDGLRVACLFYFGRSWDNVARTFKSRLESGDLVGYSPEYVNYLAHAALVSFFTLANTVTATEGFEFHEDTFPSQVFDRCLSQSVKVEQLENANFWKKYEDQWKGSICFGLDAGVKRGPEPSQTVPAKKKSYVHLMEREFVCWSHFDSVFCTKGSTLTMTNPKHKSLCKGKPKCRNFHVDRNRLPYQEEFLANIEYCRILTAQEKLLIKSILKPWY